MSSGPGVFGSNPYVAKTPVEGRIVTVLRGVSDRRGLLLESYRSRALAGNSVHELMITDTKPETGDRVDRVGIIAFFEVTTAGVVLIGDNVQIGDRVIGTVVGFDETHMPNHQNICLTGALTDGEQLGVALEAPVSVWRGSPSPD